MKVKELIKALESCPQEADVITEGRDCWGGCGSVDVSRNKNEVYLMRSKVREV